MAAGIAGGVAAGVTEAAGFSIPGVTGVFGVCVPDGSDVPDEVDAAGESCPVRIAFKRSRRSANDPAPPMGDAVAGDVDGAGGVPAGFAQGLSGRGSGPVPFGFAGSKFTSCSSSSSSSSFWSKSSGSVEIVRND